MVLIFKNPQIYPGSYSYSTSSVVARTVGLIYYLCNIQETGPSKWRGYTVCLIILWTFAYVYMSYIQCNNCHETVAHRLIITGQTCNSVTRSCEFDIKKEWLLKSPRTIQVGNVTAYTLFHRFISTPPKKKTMSSRCGLEYANYIPFRRVIPTKGCHGSHIKLHPMVRFQFWRFGECGVPLNCNKWSYPLGSHRWVIFVFGRTV